MIHMRGLMLPGFFVLFWAFISCNQNLCEEPTDVNFILGFYTMDDGIERDSVLNNLTIYGVGREDSLLYNQASARKITLPLSLLSDTSRFVFRINESSDVCVISYTRFVRLISHDCGFITEFDIHDFEHTGINIDSVAIIHPKVTNFEEEHVKIFL
jgi:hypothetical protein